MASFRSRSTRQRGARPGRDPRVFGRPIARRGGQVTLAVAAALVLIGTGAAFAVLGTGGPAGPSGTSGSTGNTGTQGSTTSTDPSITTTSTTSSGGANQSNAPDFPIVGGYEPGFGGFNDVDCPTTTTCVAVGADDNGGGLASWSNDGGSDWTSQNLPSGTPALDTVTCSNSSTCIAVGQGAIVSTSDTGSNWTLSRPPVANTTLIGVTCVGPTLCLSVGVTPQVGKAYAGEILRSINAGGTWTEDTLPAGTGGINDIVCPSATQCIAVGTSILESIDAGITWTVETVPGGTQALRSVSCSSSTMCVAIGPNVQGTFDPSAPAAAVVTTDGGLTWGQLQFPPDTASLDLTTCSSGSDCFAAGASTEPGQVAPFVESTDGGSTWTAVPSSSSQLEMIAGLSCMKSTTCAAVGRQTGGQPSSATTTDGSHWSATALSGQSVPPAAASS